MSRDATHRTITHEAERGSASVSMAMIVAVALLLVVVVSFWIHGVIRLAQAQRAADLAALAAADAHRGLTSFSPCSIAAQVAELNKAKLESCMLHTASTTVAVRVWWLRGEARAGDPRLVLNHG